MEETMHTYKIYWLGGGITEVTGVDLRDAFRKTFCHRITDIFRFEEVR